MPPTLRIVDPLSVSSLLVIPRANGIALGTATGFVVEHKARQYLITNWHVVSGRDSNTGNALSHSAALPDEIGIMHHDANQLGIWHRCDEPLAENGVQRWLEHPLGNAIDVVAVPLLKTDNAIRFFPIDLRLAEFDLQVQVAMTVSIIGFPFGLASAGAFPIWKTGHIASDPDLAYQGRPAFLIDSTTRGGMSGSPVVVRNYGGYQDSKGTHHLAAGAATRFVGVYSGRIHDQADVGIVWRPEVIHQILG